MTLRELVSLLGSAYMHQYEGIGYIHWIFDDGSHLSVLGTNLDGKLSNLSISAPVKAIEPHALPAKAD